MGHVGIGGRDQGPQAVAGGPVRHGDGLDPSAQANQRVVGLLGSSPEGQQSDVVRTRHTAHQAKVSQSGALLRRIRVLGCDEHDAASRRAAALQRGGEHRSGLRG